MSSKMLSGSPLLRGNNRIPGNQISKEVRDQIPHIFKACNDFGLDYYPAIIESLTYDEISEVAAYGGFPVRYPHWRHGMQYYELSRGYEHNMHRIYEMVINCLGAGTNVLTNRGTIPVEQVKVGDVVFSRNGPRNVVGVKEQPTSSTVSLSFEGMKKKTVCTPNHKWKTLRNGVATWVKAEDLVPGDYVFAGGKYQNYLNCPPPVLWNENDNQLDNEEVCSVPRINLPSYMTVELAELLGHITISCVTGQASGRTIHLCGDKTHLRSLVQNSFGIEAELTANVGLNSVIISNSYVNKFLSSVFKDGAVKIPSIIWQSSNEFRAAYLRGFFDSSYYFNSLLSVNYNSNQLAEDLQLMLLELGIRTTFNGTSALVDEKYYIQQFIKIVGSSSQDVLQSLQVLEASHDTLFKEDYVLNGVQDKFKEFLPDTNRVLEGNGPVFNVNLILENLTKLKAEGNHNYDSLLDLVLTPMYQIKSVDNAKDQITYDIALDHEAHDFLANGLESHNTNPCYIYYLESNTLVDIVTVIAHALGHNDFFKNNVFFSRTDTGMLNKMANHDKRIRGYMAVFGKEKVIKFIDNILRLETLVDLYDTWKVKEYNPPSFVAERTFHHPEKAFVPKDRSYMDPWINNKERMDKEKDRAKRKEAAEEMDVFSSPTKNIFGWVVENAPLTVWEQDVASMIYEEAIYFAPQRITKMTNEGFASYVDHKIMAERGFTSLGQEGADKGIFEYAIHKAGVLGGKYSSNPYKTGFNLFKDIQNRWDKGRFGDEYENCEDKRLKDNWDTKANLGHQKVMDVRKTHNDVMMIQDFFTPEFCEENQFFEYKTYPNGEVRIENRDYKSIRKKLIRKYTNAGLPDIRLTDNNYGGKGWLCIEHQWEGETLYDSYARRTLASLNTIWKKPVILLTKDGDGREIVYISDGEDYKRVKQFPRKEYERHR